jgi:hypothetical protein
VAHLRKAHCMVMAAPCPLRCRIMYHAESRTLLTLERDTEPRQTRWMIQIDCSTLAFDLDTHTQQTPRGYRQGHQGQAVPQGPCSTSVCLMCRMGWVGYLAGYV